MKSSSKFNFFLILLLIISTVAPISYTATVASQRNSKPATNPNEKKPRRNNKPIVQISLDRELKTPQVDNNEIKEEFARTISTSRSSCQSQSETKYAIVQPLFDRQETLLLDSKEKEIFFQVYQIPSQDAPVYISLFKKGNGKPLFVETVPIKAKGKLKVKIDSESLASGEYNLLMVNYCQKENGHLVPGWQMRASLIR